ncbi:uncharacterized protein CTHT_0013840 [Thermochaetoides thermophila DSM 1495]|uniref:Stc1 domain-containing protein n=1 Tax=Chaetomium thermophilum (strain DSM 1495 / CBS 144.50 / IMI 039719) TaxID=759272 RepID=G0S1J6_CHATD|nr:hypothetical protein CTHT_0013840 [Thermochaetoides thermophila DSM 1495]EGS22906.1 hypothetical protein CTHT_0013840 [Thermochaetoides thermophila DSM 1495]
MARTGFIGKAAESKVVRCVGGNHWVYLTELSHSQRQKYHNLKNAGRATPCNAQICCPEHVDMVDGNGNIRPKDGVECDICQRVLPPDAFSKSTFRSGQPICKGCRSDTQIPLEAAAVVADHDERMTEEQFYYRNRFILGSNEVYEFEDEDVVPTLPKLPFSHPKYFRRSENSLQDASWEETDNSNSLGASSSSSGTDLSSLCSPANGEAEAEFNLASFKVDLDQFIPEHLRNVAEEPYTPPHWLLPSEFFQVTTVTKRTEICYRVNPCFAGFANGPNGTQIGVNEVNDDDWESLPAPDSTLNDKDGGWDEDYYNVADSWDAPNNAVDSWDTPHNAAGSLDMPNNAADSWDAPNNAPTNNNTSNSASNNNNVYGENHNYNSRRGNSHRRNNSHRRDESSNQNVPALIADQAAERPEETNTRPSGKSHTTQNSDNSATNVVTGTTGTKTPYNRNMNRGVETRHFRHNHYFAPGRQYNNNGHVNKNHGNNGKHTSKGNRSGNNGDSNRHDGNGNHPDNNNGHRANSSNNNNRFGNHHRNNSNIGQNSFQQGEKWHNSNRQSNGNSNAHSSNNYFCNSNGSSGSRRNNRWEKDPAGTRKTAHILPFFASYRDPGSMARQ